MNRPARFDPGVLVIVLSVAILGATGWLLYTNLRTDEITARLESGETLQVSVVIEQEGRPLLSNVLLYNPRSNRLAMFDIPGDLGAILDDLDRVDRLSVLYENGNFQAYRQELSNLLGVAVPYYLYMDLSQLSNVVDLMGGLELFISENFQRASIADQPSVDSAAAVSGTEMVVPAAPRSGGDAPLLPSGTVTLDGAKVRSYVAFRAPNEGAIERVSRQQEFLQSLVQDIGRNAEFLKHADVTRFLTEYINTNLTDRALLALIEELSQLDSSTVITRRVQGALREVAIGGETRRLLFPHFEGQWLRQTVRQVEQSLSAPSEGEVPHRSIALQILNGTQENGLASRTRALYEGYGFNVVGVGNAGDQAYAETVVMNHGEGGSAAEQVARIIRAQRVVDSDAPPEISGGYQGTIDVTIILGEDFDGTYVR